MFTEAELDDLKNDVTQFIQDNVPLIEDADRALQLINSGYIAQGLAAIGFLSKLKDIKDKIPEAVISEDNHGLLPIHYAAMYGHLEVVCWLIEQGVELDEESKIGYTPLYIALLRGHFTIAEELLNSGVDINSEDPHGGTYLHYCVIKGIPSAVKFLLENNIKISQAFPRKLSPLHCAAEIADQNLSVQITKLILNRFTLTKFGEENISKLFKAKSSHGNTALHLAVMKGNINFVQELKKYKPQFVVTSVIKNNEGLTPLALAKKLGNQVMIELLKPNLVRTPAMFPAAEPKALKREVEDITSPEEQIISGVSSLII